MEVVAEEIGAHPGKAGGVRRCGKGQGGETGGCGQAEAHRQNSVNGGGER
jgi:hypothetical protein